MDLKSGLAAQSVNFAAYTTATGAAVTVTSATAGLSLWYRRGVAGAKTAISPSDLATLATAWASGGILVIEGAEHRLDLPDAAIAAGVLSVSWGGTATGITIDGGTANLIGQANTASDATHVNGTAQTERDLGAGVLVSDKTGFTLSVTPPTAGAIATAVWQDATAADFTTAHSIGLGLYIDNHAPGAASGLAVVGSAMGLANGSIVTASFGTCVTPVTAEISAILAAMPTGGQPLRYVASIGVVYCTREDIEDVFGLGNVAKWADLDADADATKITSRIARSAVVATTELEDRLRGRGYTLPLTGSSATVVNWCAVRAGLWLHDSRGMEDSETDAYAQHRRQLDQTIREILAGQRRIDAPTEGAAAGAPHVVRDHHGNPRHGNFPY